MTTSVDLHVPPSLLMHHKAMTEDKYEDLSMSDSRFTENGEEEETTHEEEVAITAAEQDDDVASKSSRTSMSAFMSSLVGVHQTAEDWSFCLQVDNAKPRDLPPPSDNNATSSSDSSSAVNIRGKNGISRWESAPAAPKELASKRPRAMRPWRWPSAISGSSSNGSNSTNSVGVGTKKADAPISRPQRHDSNRSLMNNSLMNNSLMSKNAKRPQRHDSNRSLARENSLADLFTPLPTGGRHDSTMAINSMTNSMAGHSMDLRVLLECTEEDDMSVVGDLEDGVYLHVPRTMNQSGNSLWSSASTMTASFRTMASNRSLMSHYSREWNSSMHQSFSVSNGSGSNHKCGSGCVQQDPNSSHRSLFCKSEEERPMRPPRRTNSRELQRDLHFNSNACKTPVRVPIRSTSDRSMLNSSSHHDSSVVPAADVGMHEDANNESMSSMPLSSMPPLMFAASGSSSMFPPMMFQDSSANFSFKLIRSLSEQTMDTTWRENNRKQAEESSTDVAAVATAGRPKLKRTLSDSLLLFTESFANTIVTDYGDYH